MRKRIRMIPSLLLAVFCMCMGIFGDDKRLIVPSIILLVLSLHDAYEIYKENKKNKNGGPDEKQSSEADGKKYCPNCGNYSESDTCDVCGERVKVE